MRTVLAVLFCLVIAITMALAGSDHGIRVLGMPVFALCAFTAMALQWLTFLPSWWRRSEHGFDLAGSVAFILVMIMALLLTDHRDPRSLALLALVSLWALRLGGFLFLRVQRHGDRRFNRIKHSFGRFLLTFTLQGVWVIVTSSAALAAVTTESPRAPGPFMASGLVLWLAGFSLQVVADEQKRRFRSIAGNRHRFITSGLWAWSRHPNYFGEILLWTGVAVIALPVLKGWQYLTLVSPLFVWLLLTRLSGIPLLEKQAEQRWGDDPVYQRWKARTPALFPRPPADK